VKTFSNEIIHQMIFSVWVFKQKMKQ